MKILYATSEAVPFIKTGGLADVAGSLPPALAQEGAEIAVVLPLYQKVKDKYGDGGYAKHYVVDEDYLCFLQTIRELITDRKAFEERYRTINKKSLLS